MLGSIVAIALLVSPAFAISNFTVTPSPQNIPTLGTTGIIITKTASCTTTDTLHAIFVADPKGEVFQYNLVTNPQGIQETFTACGQSTTVTFGPSSLGWSCFSGSCASNPSKTDVSGKYNVDVTYGVSTINHGNSYFAVGNVFFVPEFGISAVAVVSVSLLGLVLLRKRALPKLQ